MNVCEVHCLTTRKPTTTMSQLENNKGSILIKQLGHLPYQHAEEQDP